MVTQLKIGGYEPVLLTPQTSTGLPLYASSISTSLVTFPCDGLPKRSNQLISDVMRYLPLVSLSTDHVRRERRVGETAKWYRSFRG